MGNKSNWKGFEKEIADALGGKRRNFSQFASARSRNRGSNVTDIFFPKSKLKEMPFLRDLKIECKKRRSLNVYDEFLVARLKYQKSETDQVILACRRPMSTKKWKKTKTRERLIKKAIKIGMTKKEAEKAIRKSMYSQPLVTVDLEFFKELWEAWLRRKRAELIRASKSDS